jgi:hypothetical protein
VEVSDEGVDGVAEGTVREDGWRVRTGSGVDSIRERLDVIVLVFLQIGVQ